MLTQILQQVDVTQLIIVSATAAGGALVVWYRKRIAGWRAFWRNVISGLHNITDLHNDVKGIRYFVGPNGGGSLMDSVKRTEKVVGTLVEQMDIVVRTMLAENDSDDDVARFHCDADGSLVYANQLYARWLKIGKDELSGWNYMNYVHFDDIARVRRHWEICRNEHRQYRSLHRLVAADGEVFEVEVITTPIPETSPAKRWVGAIRRTDNDRRKCETV